MNNRFKILFSQKNIDILQWILIIGLLCFSLHLKNKRDKTSECIEKYIYEREKIINDKNDTIRKLKLNFFELELNQTNK